MLAYQQVRIILTIMQLKCDSRSQSKKATLSEDTNRVPGVCSVSPQGVDPEAMICLDSIGGRAEIGGCY